jgi:predicted nucleic acid-binding protein
MGVAEAPVCNISRPASFKNLLHKWCPYPYLAPAYGCRQSTSVQHPLAGMNTKEGAVLFDTMRFAKEGQVELGHSAMIELENAANEIAARKSFVESVMHVAAAFQNLSGDIVQRAQAIVQSYGLQALDAVHIASAEAAQVDFFITFDYTVLKRYGGTLRIITPLMFEQEYENHH